MDENIRSFGVITLITENSLQASLLKDSLENCLDVVINIAPLDTLQGCHFAKEGNVSEIMMVDMSVYSNKLDKIYADCKSRFFPESREVLINCEKDIHYTDLTEWNNLVGVFYVSDDIKLLSLGIEKILHGEMWFSRRLSQEYILYYRGKHNVTTSVAYNKLTKREQQIIKLLGHGNSNNQIADKLFVSENTVKTHLHNVFKKINAKNRLQALLWAKENIGDEEFY